MRTRVLFPHLSNQSIQSPYLSNKKGWLNCIGGGYKKQLHQCCFGFKTNRKLLLISFLDQMLCSLQTTRLVVVKKRMWITSEWYGTKTVDHETDYCISKQSVTSPLGSSFTKWKNLPLPSVSMSSSSFLISTIFSSFWIQMQKPTSVIHVCICRQCHLQAKF